MKLNSQGMQILMGELQPNEIWAIYLMGLGKEMADIVTKLDLTRIISILCKKLNWTEADEDSLDLLFDDEEDISTLENISSLDTSLKEEIPGNSETMTDSNSANTYLQEEVKSKLNFCSEMSLNHSSTDSENENEENSFSVQFTSPKQISERPSKEQDMGERILEEEIPDVSPVITDAESMYTNLHEEVMEIAGKTDDKQISCSKGDKTFETKFSCFSCDYKCSVKHNLKVHERTHTCDKPFSCSQCEYKTSDKGNLKRHERIHAGDKPFSCSQCDYRCTQLVHLKRP